MLIQGKALQKFNLFFFFQFLKKFNNFLII